VEGLLRLLTPTVKFHTLSLYKGCRIRANFFTSSSRTYPDWTLLLSLDGVKYPSQTYYSRSERRIPKALTDEKHEKNTHGRAADVDSSELCESMGGTGGNR
jgi:hypothetical protein